MSYLDLPRFHLSGKFFANPSTINNQPQNNNPSQPLTNDPNAFPGSVGWNPSGLSLWKLQLTVGTLVDANGNPVSGADTLHGATLASTGQPNHAKLVDLDSDQQNISQVWGLNVELTLAGGAVAFSGSVDPCCISDLWGRAVISGAQGVAVAGAAYQTVIRVTEWGDLSGSPTLQALQAAAGDTLSLRWAVDGYNADENDPRFNWGRMLATLGPAFPGEPIRVLNARRLMFAGSSPPGPPILWFAPFRLDEQRSRLVFDLGNSVADSEQNGGPPAVNQITVLLDANGSSVVAGQLQFTAEQYIANAGVFEFPLTAAQLQLARTTSVGLSTQAFGSTHRLLEVPDGRLAQADLPFLRLEPGERADVDFYANVWGKPDAGRALDLALVFPGGTRNRNNIPANGLLVSTPGGDQPLPYTVTTDAAGKATVTFVGGTVPAASKAAWRKNNDEDGQVYFVGGSWWPDMLTSSGSPPVSVKVFDPYEPATTPPTWQDVQPIMYYYARLYPGMRDIIDISDYNTLTQPISVARAVHRTLMLPREHPNHMPVSRDMSRAKAKAIGAWVAAGCPLAPGDGHGHGGGQGNVSAALAPESAAPPPADGAPAGPPDPIHFGPGNDSIKSRRIAPE